MIVIVTIIISIVFQVSSYPKNGKVLLYLLDLIIVTRLCFYSAWFTNKLVGFSAGFETRNL